MAIFKKNKDDAATVQATAGKTDAGADKGQKPQLKDGSDSSIKKDSATNKDAKPHVQNGQILGLILDKLKELNDNLNSRISENEKRLTALEKKMSEGGTDSALRSDIDEMKKNIEMFNVAFELISNQYNPFFDSKTVVAETGRAETVQRASQDSGRGSYATSAVNEQFLTGRGDASSGRNSSAEYEFVPEMPTDDDENDHFFKDRVTGQKIDVVDSIGEPMSEDNVVKVRKGDKIEQILIEDSIVEEERKKEEQMRLLQMKKTRPAVSVTKTTKRTATSATQATQATPAAVAVRVRAVKPIKSATVVKSAKSVKSVKSARPAGSVKSGKVTKPVNAGKKGKGGKPIRAKKVIKQLKTLKTAVKKENPKANPKANLKEKINTAMKAVKAVNVKDNTKKSGSKSNEARQVQKVIKEMVTINDDMKKEIIVSLISDKKNEGSKRFLKQVKGDSRFFSAGKNSMSSLYDLTIELNNDSMLFDTHVGPRKDHFADWIESSLKMKALAAKLRDIKDSDEYLIAILSYV